MHLAVPEGLPEAAHRAAVARAQDEVLAALGPHGELVHRFTYVPGLALAALDPVGQDLLRQHPAVLGLGPDVPGRASLDQSAPFVGVPAAQALGFTGLGRRVAVVDSGVDGDHPDLADDLVDAACFCATGVQCCGASGSVGFGVLAAEDDTGHGTHVTGIITSGGVVAPAGIAPDAEVVVVRVMRQGVFQNSGDLIAALDWIRTVHPEVDAVNLSLGTLQVFPTPCDQPAPGYSPPVFIGLMGTAFTLLRQAGILPVVASGNDASSVGMSAPACLSNAFSVGATANAADVVAGFSNATAALDLWAPGGDILSSFLVGTSLSQSGTSMAAPHVTAAAALVHQANGHHPVAAVEACLRSSPAWITDARSGASAPRLSLPDAVAACGPFPLGAGCAVDLECASGRCVDGVCCNTACGGGATDCLACAVAAGSSQDGRCEVASAGAPCRPSAGTCDVAELCDGASSACPPDVVRPGGQECRASAGPCDLPEACTGVTGACPPDAKFGGVCRPAAGPCDRPEQCDGVRDTCPEDDHFGGGTECRPAAGPCDAVERCDGVTAACPPDARATGVCRPAVGLCDAVERCDGTSTQCPADEVRGAGTLCRPAVAVCDAPETCDGASATCPLDQKRNTTCRPARGPCDVAEDCDGGSDACPPDLHLGGEVTCRPAAGPCDAAELCTGTSTACPPDLLSTGLCRPAAGPCDVSERCDGRAPACPDDVSAPDGTSCADARTCNGAEACQDGVCVAGAPVTCAPPDACQVGACAEPAGCVFTAVPGCCLDDSACDDGDPATLDRCEAGHCLHPRGCVGPEDCPAPPACALATCVDQRCGVAPDPSCPGSLSPPGGGCGCQVGRGPGEGPGGLLLGLLVGAGMARRRGRGSASRPSEKSPTRCAGSFSVERPDRLRLSSVAYGQICSLFVGPFHEKSLRGSHGPLLRWPASHLTQKYLT